MKRFLTLMLMLSVALPTVAQEPTRPTDSLDLLDVHPSFKNGDLNRFRRWVMQHMNYPEIMVEDGLKGKVVISFVVDKTGQVRDLELVESFHPIFDATVMRTIDKSPRWSPGILNGEPVSVRYTLPVTFKIEKASPSYPSATRSYRFPSRAGSPHPYGSGRARTQ